MNCDSFHEQLAELAVGSLDTTDRTHLYNHAAACAPCQLALENMSAVADRLLEECPEIEPPPGFEQRVLTQLVNGSDIVAAAALMGRGRTRLRLVAIVGSLLLISAGVSGAAVRHFDERENHASVLHPLRAGTIIRADGRPSGKVTLVDRPRPMLLVTIDHPRPFTGRVNCELESTIGQKSVVGSWSYDDVEAGAWAVGLTPEWLSSTRMRILDASGKLMASADLA